MLPKETFDCNKNYKFLYQGLEELQWENINGIYKYLQKFDKFPVGLITTRFFSKGI